MRQIVIISLLSLLTLTTSCNKELFDINITGNWEVNSKITPSISGTFNPDVVNQYQDQVKFLKDSYDDLTALMTYPTSVTFNLDKRSSSMIFPDGSSFTGTLEPIQGSKNTFTVKNSKYPNGIIANTMDDEMYLIFPTEYMLYVLQSVITDISEWDIYLELIVSFEGAVEYLRK